MPRQMVPARVSNRVAVALLFPILAADFKSLNLWSPPLMPTSARVYPSHSSNSPSSSSGPGTVPRAASVPSPNGSSLPQWLAELGLTNGDYFLDSKPRAKRAMKSSCFSPAARIHICLGLHTMGFQQELAVKMVAGERVPLQPVDVCAMTGIKRNNFRFHMDELEAAGLAKCEGSTKGQVMLYSWALPRPVEPRKIVIDPVTITANLPPELVSILTRYRVKLPADFVTDPMTIAELERLAQVTKEAELSLRRYVDCHRSGALYKDERNERNIERNEERGGEETSSLVEEPEETPAPPPSPPVSLPSPDTPPTPSTALVVTDPESEAAWDRFRTIMDGCGKPVSVLRTSACRAEFFKYPIETQLRIVDDAIVRSGGKWDLPEFTPDPLKHLRSQVWDTEPIKPRTLPARKSARHQQSDDVLRRLMEDSIRRDREREGLGP